MFFLLVPVSRVLGVELGYGLNGMWAAAVAYSCGAALVMTLKFRGGAWKDIQL